MSSPTVTFVGHAPATERARAPLRRASMCTMPNHWRCTVDVGIRQLRDDLRHWLDVVGDGGEVVITERGRPIARLSGVSSREPLERLIAAGIVTRAKRPRRRDSDHSRVKSEGPVSELVAEQRR